jgi:23S rRNA-/tRNA-specific pseudouridylate synthase
MAATTIPAAPGPLPDVLARDAPQSLDATPVSALHACADFLCVDKPHDVRMDGAAFPCTMEKLVAHHFPLGPSTSKFYRHVHQLDYATSGALLYATTSEAAAAAALLFQERRTRKEYLAVVHGHVTSVPVGRRGVRAVSLAELGGAGSSEGDLISRLKTKAATASVGAASAALAAKVAATGLVPARQPQHYYGVLKASAASRGLLGSGASSGKGAAAAPAAAAAAAPSAPTSSPAPPFFTSVGQSLASANWGDLKYRARQQREAMGRTGVGEVDDRAAVWKAAATRLLESGDPAHPVLLPDPAALVVSLDLAALTEADWASTVFETCMAAAAADEARFRRDKSEGAPARKGRKRTLSAGEGEGEGEGEDGVGATTIAHPASSSSSSSTTAAAVEPVMFLVDLPIADMTADGSDFRMRIVEPDGDNGGAPAPPLTGAAAPRDATTVVRVLSLGTYKGAPVTKLLLTPITGRRHQLRLHTAAVGHPILGDATYAAPVVEALWGRAAADVEAAAPRMMLHAWRLALDFPWLATIPMRAYKSARRWAIAKAASGGAGGEEGGAAAGVEGAAGDGATGGSLRELRFEAPDPFLPGHTLMEGLAL